MTKPNRSARYKEDTLLLVLFCLLMFASPFTRLWALDTTHWFLPYLLWLAIILLGAWLHRRYARHDL